MMDDEDEADYEDYKLRRRIVRGKTAEIQLQLNLDREPVYLRIGKYRNAQPNLYEKVTNNTDTYFRFYIQKEDRWICWLSPEQQENGAELPDDGVCFLNSYSDFGSTNAPTAYKLEVIRQNVKCTVAHVNLEKI
jgi:hypothetical protein